MVLTIAIESSEVKAKKLKVKNILEKNRLERNKEQKLVYYDLSRIFYDVFYGNGKNSKKLTMK